MGHACVLVHVQKSEESFGESVLFPSWVPGIGTQVDLNVFFSCTTPYSVRQGLSLRLDFIDSGWLANESSRPACSPHLLPSLGLQALPTEHSSDVGC